MNNSKYGRVLSEQDVMDQEAVAMSLSVGASGSYRGGDEQAAQDYSTAAFETYAESDAYRDAGHNVAHKTAICLSGGGNRSTSFSLGVLQSLAKAKVLESSAYLSAVSGGNFTLSWLTRWRSEAAKDKPWTQDLLEEKPDSFSRRQRDIDPVRRLRSYSNYLAPRTGLTKDSVAFGLSAVRKFSYNLIAWMLIFLTFAAGVRAVIATVAAGQILIHPLLADNNLSGLTYKADAIPLFVTPSHWTGASLRELMVDPVIYATLIVPIAVLIIALLGWIYALVVLRSKPIGQEGVSHTSAKPWLFAAAWFAIFVLFGVIPEYLWDVVVVQDAGTNSGFLSFALATSVTITAIGGLATSIPKGIQDQAKSLFDKLKAYTLEFVSLAMLTALAVVSGYLVRAIADGGWFSLASNDGWEKAKEAGQSSWEALGEKIVAYEQAKAEEKADILSGLHTQAEKLAGDFADITHIEIAQYGDNWWWFWIFFTVLAAAAFFFSEMAGANRSSLHAVYSTRLIRAFLGTARSNRPIQNASGPDFDYDDDILLEDIRFDRHHKTGASGETIEEPERKLFPLFPVINMTLNIQGSRGNRRDWQERKGAPFIATPLHVGSELLREDHPDHMPPGSRDTATGYVRAEELGADGDLRFAQMSLGRAMTISGAVASPNMGFYTRPIVSIAMAILNIRLGWWLRNPVQDQFDETPAWWPFPPSLNEPFSGVLYLFREAFGILKDKDRWLYLSDGGHFDNLGLYEMIRRECREILVVDATYDPQFDYSDLLSTLRKIRVDFGVNINLPSSLPGQAGEGKDKRFVIGEIEYGLEQSQNSKNGRLILLKPTLLAADPPGLSQYREQSRSGKSVFPHQSTLDQFYDETQFESYRMLGSISAEQMVRTLSERDTGLFSSEGAEFDSHYPKPALPVNDGGANGGNDEPVDGGEGDGAPPGPPPANDTAPMPSDDGGGALVSGMLKTLQGMPTSDLLLRAFGAVAATTITVSVAADGGEGLGYLAASTASVVVPTVSPEAPVTESSGGEDQDCTQCDIDNETLEKAAAIKKDLERISDQLVRLDELANSETLPAIQNGSTTLNGKIEDLPGDGQNGNYSAELERIENNLQTVLVEVRALKPVSREDFNPVFREDFNPVSREDFNTALRSLRDADREQQGRLRGLEDGRGQSNGDINALQRQIDFLIAQISPLARQDQ